VNRDHIRGGYAALRPYVYARPDMTGFIQHVFGATISARYDTPIGSHIEATIDDSILVLEVADDFPDNTSPTKCSVYIYVEDVDDTYAKALARGAISISAPEDKPYNERQCGIQDSFGNTWWISRFIGD